MSRRNDYDYFDLDNFDDSIDSREYRRRQQQRRSASYAARPSSQRSARRPVKRRNKRRTRNRIIIVASALIILFVIIFIITFTSSNSIATSSRVKIYAKVSIDLIELSNKSLSNLFEFVVEGNIITGVSTLVIKSSLLTHFTNIPLLK